MKKKTQKLVLAFLLGVLTASVTLETYHTIHELNQQVAGIVGFLQAVGGSK